MEGWSELISTYPDVPEPKHLAKALHAADNLLSADLASFEIEWLVETLLYKPVGVLNMISSKNASEEWLKNIADAFKIISKIVIKYWSVLEDDSEKIVQYCMQPYDPQTKKEAINCLINVLKKPGVNVDDAGAQVHALEGSRTCKAPLALLIGTICRYHPESVSRHYTRIWRIYLKMLQPTQVTDTIVNAVLQGIDGLLDNFGQDLPIAELNDFYNNLSRRCAKLAKCIEPLLSILQSHAGLFKEKLREDQVLRLFLWGLNSPSIKGALVAIYDVVFEDAEEQRIQDIIQAEIQPRMESESSLVRLTALRIAMNAQIHHRVRLANMYRPDALEFQLRNRMISHQDAELVSLCLESHEGYTRSLLEASILFFENIPENLRREVVVKGILAASEDNRKVALNQLVELSCQDGYLERYSEVWRGILDPDARKPEVFDETVHHIAFLLKSLLDAPTKNLEQVLSLSSVLSFVLSVREKDDRPQYCELLKPILLELSAVLCVSPSTLLSPKYVCVEMFENNSMLQDLLTSLNNNTQVEIVDNLPLLQAIFNKDVVDTKLLIKGVSEMDIFLKSRKNLDRRLVVDIMKQLLKLQSIMDASTSDNRVLLRNIAMFAGEHGKFLEKENFLDDIYFMEMKNKITINITNYELDLFRVLQISFLWEDPELLYCLLVIISVNLRDRPAAYLQSIAWRCIHSLLKCHCLVDVNPVLQMCATVQCVQQAIESISDEINPDVRRMLCDSVLVMLRHNPGSETTVKLLTLVAEQFLVMIRSPHQPIYECGLDITRIFLATLDENHDLTIKYLPEILILMTKKVLEAVYNTAADLFVRHIDIFEESIIKYIITGIIKNIKVNKNKVHIELVLMFLKKIFDVKAYDTFQLVDEIFDGLDSAELHIEEDNVDVFVNVLQILVLSKPIFDFDDGMAKSVITNNCIVVNKISTVLDNNNVEVTSNILKFLTEYASALIDVEEKQTIQCLCRLIESMPPSLVCLLKKDLSVCISTFKAKKCEIPEEILQSFHKWVDIFNVERLNEELNEKLSVLIPVSDASNDFADRVQSLYVMSKIFGVPVFKTDNWTKVLMENGEKVSNTVVSNLLHVANKNLSVTAFENILKDNKDFVKKYMNVYFEKILETSMDLVKDFFVHLLNYFVNNYEKYQEYYGDIVRFMENIWPRFDEKEKLAVASDCLRMPGDVGQITPVQWVIQLIIEDESIEDKIKMITILPGGEMYSACYRRVAGLLPVRISEARGHAGVLRALLDALARTGDHVLLNIVVNLAAADDTRGWWDNAIDACMASLATRKDKKIYDAAFRACKKRSGMGCYRRVLVPLLRHSSRAFCEQFTSKIIQEVLLTLKTGYREPSNTDMYKERVISYAKAFAILQVVIEKLSHESLKSGRLNESVKDRPVAPPWYFVSLVCTYSVTLMVKVQCPDDATEEIRQACLQLQCAAYNCLTSAICKSRPSQKQYTRVFNATAWSKIVDPEVEYEFQPRAYWGYSRTSEQRDNRSSASSSFTRTVRTRIFMTTLSENPLQYDMIPNDDEEEGDEDTDPVGYDNHPLNAHGCLTTITKLLHHASTLENTEWLTRLSEGLTSSSLPLNARWTLAQAVCYTEVDLKAHASTLIPALLELIAATPKVMNNKQTLNNLHIDILWTIIKWSVPELPSYNHLSISVQYLIHSCMEYRSQKAVGRRLLNTLNSLLQVYGTRVQVPWTAFEEYCNKNTENISFLLPIFQRILKNGIALPDLMPYILRIDASLWKNKLPEVFGLAFSLDKREEYLETFWQILGKVKKNVSDFVKALLCAMRVCSRCCNRQLFKTIIDLAPKVENANCLAIIGIYLDNLELDDGSWTEVFETIDLMSLLDSQFKMDAMKVVHGGFKFMDEEMRNAVMSSIGQNCQSGLTAVRKQAFAVILKVFQDMVQVKDERSAKRQAKSGTRILETLRSNIGYHHQVIKHLSRGLFDADADISKMIRDGVNVCLSEDMAKRLAELFYLIFYYVKHDRLELSEYGYVFLDLLFSDIKQQDAFKNKKFSEQPLPTSNINGGCATFTSGVTNRQKQISKKNYLRNIDVEMALVDILEVFLQSAKRNSQICLELCVQVMRRVHAESSSPRFNLGEIMAELLIAVLNKEPNSLTPLYLEASRIFMNKVSNIDGFRDSLKVLQNKVRDENLLYLNTVYEDFILRKEGRNFFNFSVKEDSDVEMKSENQGFSIEGLMEVFGHLANWDDVRAQDKRSVEEVLPPLLVEEKQFESVLNEYFLEGLSPLGYSHWFNKMAGAYCTFKFNQTMTQYKQQWLADAQRWPTAGFVTSAVIEAMRWPQETVVKACEIRPHECLAEWAGRLMIRAAYYTGESNQSVCRGDELRWCSDANKRQLPRLALQCIERNKSSLMEDEALAWFHQKIQAHRVLALKTNDGTMLRKTLEAAVRQDTENDLCLKRLILQLRSDSGSLSKTDLDAVFLSIDRHNNSLVNGAVTSSTDGDIKSIYDMAMHYYDDQWDDNDVSSQGEIIYSIIHIIEKYLNYNLSKEHNLLISVLLNKLTLYKGTLDEQTAKKILSQIALMLPDLDSFSVNHLKTLSHVFPGEIWSEHQGMNDEEALAHCKEYLRLICDPQYTLLQFCDRLLRERDSDKWQIIFGKMKSTLFGTSYGGTEYISLNNFKNKLFAIENATNDERLTTVRSIREELMKKPQRSGLRLSQLSPQLTRSHVLEEQAHHLGKLLALPPTLRIVKFEEQVHMFGDSIRRPCVVSVLLSNGATKRYIIKTGEPLDNDASVQRAIAILPKLFKVQVRSYNVTTLTEESAIIECLEAHERLRDLMGTKVNIPDNRINDDSVVLSPSLALEQFTAMCNRLPVDTLRSSIEGRCASTQEFISKKQVFLETLSSMTITNWLFGVGDRHLYNIMWSKRDGGICGVDWASVFQYGLREFVPARLTASLLAVCDVKVLEARLQNILENLRQNQKLYDAFVRTSFYWKGRDFKELTYIKGILYGHMVSYQITRDVMDQSNLLHKENCIGILDSVFENFQFKQTYTVEEQVSCLLKHCTEPGLLAVIPSGWEAFV